MDINWYPGHMAKTRRVILDTMKQVDIVIELVDARIPTASKNPDIAELIGKKNWGKGLKVAIAEDESLEIDCNVVVAYGQNIVTVAGNVQQAVSGAVESMSGVKVTSVNVNICEIVRQ